MSTKACFLYSTITDGSIIPIFAKKKDITGNWNASPIKSVNETKVLIYESKVTIVLTCSDTLYEARNLQEIGNRRKYETTNPIINKEYAAIITLKEYFFSFSYKAGDTYLNNS